MSDAMHLGSDIAGWIEPLAPAPALSQRIHVTLERLIIARELPPGMRLVEGDLAQMLGVSRGPVREALQRLAQDGFVELRPRQGAFVHVPTLAEIDEFFDVRRPLEAEAARLAALRITDESAFSLRDCVRRAEESLARNQDPASTVEDFHRLVSSIASNQLLRQFLDLLSKRSEWYMAPFEPEQGRKAWSEHAVIAEAIARGQDTEAEAAMVTHIDRKRERYKKLHAANHERSRLS